MIPPGSRYEEAAKESVVSHMYDQFGFTLVEQDKPGHYHKHEEAREATYRVTTLPLPPQAPQEYYAKDTESFQFIAYKFVRNPLQWWEVAEANPQIWYPLDLAMGSYIRIPS